MLFMPVFFQTAPYNKNSIPWANATRNEQDQWYPFQDSLGYNADMEVEWINPFDVSWGIIGSITVGVNMCVAILLRLLASY